MPYNTKAKRAAYNARRRGSVKAKEQVRAWRCANRSKVNAYKRVRWQKERDDPKVRETRKQNAKRRATMLRCDALLMYGVSCACCGESEIAFLTFDHRDNSGYKHRKQLGSSTAFYQWLLEERRNNIRVLCWNCNCGRRLTGGVCPHKGGVY